MSTEHTSTGMPARRLKELLGPVAVECAQMAGLSRNAWHSRCSRNLSVEPHRVQIMRNHLLRMIQHQQDVAGEMYGHSAHQKKQDAERPHLAEYQDYSVRNTWAEAVDTSLFGSQNRSPLVDSVVC